MRRVLSTLEGGRRPVNTVGLAPLNWELAPLLRRWNAAAERPEVLKISLPSTKNSQKQRRRDRQGRQQTHHGLPVVRRGRQIRSASRVLSLADP